MADDKRKAGRPATGQTPKHGVRVPDHVWKEAKKKAAAEGRTITDVIDECLRKFLKK